MQTPKPPPHPTNSRGMTDEADIGSGEKSPGQAETDEQIRQIPPLPPAGQNPAKPGDPEQAKN